MTTPALADAIAPFVNAKLSSAPRKASIDIFGQAECRDADVRGVTSEGVQIFFINAVRTERWADIRKVGIASHGPDGWRDGAYREIDGRELAA